jgi:hypothetical protein
MSPMEKKKYFILFFFVIDHNIELFLQARFNKIEIIIKEMT